jgi:hypothetical protein
MTSKKNKITVIKLHNYKKWHQILKKCLLSDVLRTRVMRRSHWTTQRRRRRRKRQRDGDERKAPPPAPSLKSSAPPTPTAAGRGGRNPIFRTSPPDIAPLSPVPTTSPCGLATPVVFLSAAATVTEGMPRMRMLLRAGTAAAPWRRAAALPPMVAARQKAGVVDPPELRRRGVTGWEVCLLRGSRPAAG